MAKGIYVGVDNIARKVKKAYVGITELKNLCPAIDGANGFTIRSNSGTATGESSTAHTKYSQQALKLNIVDTDTTEVYASSSISLPLNSEHIYYARLEAYQETKFGSMEIYFPIAEPHFFNLGAESAGQWNMYSAVMSRSGFTTGNYTFRLDFNRERSTATTGSVWYDGWMIIDLTEAFGSGNEPTKEWCDANIPYFENTFAVKNYAGIGKARKIKKGYIGVGGVARPFFSAEQKLMYYGIITPFTVSRARQTSTSIGDYALLAGGVDSSFSSIKNVYKVDKNLITGTVTNLSTAKSFANAQEGATTVGDYAIINGDSIDTYDKNLVHGTISDTATGSATTIGDYAIFANVKAVVAYDKNLVKTDVTQMTEVRRDHASTSIGNYALIAGGHASSDTSTTYASVLTYDKNLVAGTATSLQNERYNLSSARTEKHAVFAGGEKYASTENNAVDCYDVNLVRSTLTTINGNRSDLAGTGIGDFIIFAGGWNNSKYVNTVDVYDANLVHSNPFSLSGTRSEFTAVTIGNYALFSGGYDATKTVDVFQLVG